MLLQVPKVASGDDALVFQCVWCLAINDTHPRSRCSRRRWNLEHLVTRWGGRVLLFVVSAIVLSIAVVAYRNVLPALCGDSWTLWAFLVLLTVLFELNIFFNYFMSVFSVAGSTKRDWPEPFIAESYADTGGRGNRKRGVNASANVANGDVGDADGNSNVGYGGNTGGGGGGGAGGAKTWGVGTEGLAEEGALKGATGASIGGGGGDGGGGGERRVPRHAFKDCRLCVPCGGAKPPKAHHCRTCGTCVQSMDHHCPFVNNCVGADNMRHFLLFLGWATAGCAYGVLLALLAVREARLHPLV